MIFYLGGMKQSLDAMAQVDAFWLADVVCLRV